jgi:glutamate carboxypeptidase
MPTRRIGARPPDPQAKRARHASSDARALRVYCARETDGDDMRQRFSFVSLLAAGLLLLAARDVCAQAGDPAVEAAIGAAAEASLPRALELLTQAVDINSGTLNLAGVRQVGDLFAKELAALGLRTQWVDGAPFQRAGHLVATKEGQGRCVLLIGHLDTVFEADSPFQGFAIEGDDRARGPGAIDMKGGDVIIVEALRALRTAGALERACIRVVMTGDEEKLGRPITAARAALVEQAKKADVALGFEDGDGRPETAVVSRRGSSQWVLRATGTPAHSSQIFKPEYGSGAIFETARILARFHDELSSWENLTFSPGVIVGGTAAELETDQGRGEASGKNNVIARSASATGDLRAISPQQLRDAEQRMREITAAHHPGTSAELEFDHGYPPMAATDGNRALLALYDQVSRDLGYGPVGSDDPRNAGAADVSFAAEHVEMAIDGLGLMGTGGHTDQETADLGTLGMQTKRAALLIHRLTSGR